MALLLALGELAGIVSRQVYVTAGLWAVGGDGLGGWGCRLASGCRGKEGFPLQLPSLPQELPSSCWNHASPARTRCSPMVTLFIEQSLQADVNRVLESGDSDQVRRLPLPPSLCSPSPSSYHPSTPPP
jgi:hypothetical protein